VSDEPQADPHLARRWQEVQEVTASVVDWALEDEAVRAVAVVGSWACGNPDPDSDLDMVVLAGETDRLLSAEDWLDRLGALPPVGHERWGVLSARRARLASGLEIELGLAPPSWAATDPIDVGSSQVVRDGLRIAFDPDGLLMGLQRALGIEPLYWEEPIRVVAYDPAWPQRFETERALLERTIGPWITGAVHHVGSTAVAGLAAKPVIDVLVGVEDLVSSRACFDVLRGLGYMYAPYRESEMHWFCKPSPSYRTHHLHLVPTGSRRYRDELEFRDRLRSCPELAAEYALLKGDLATHHEHDREGYTQGKREFIARALSEGVAKRVTLRALAEGDEAELLRIHSTPEVRRWWDAPDERFPWDEPESTRFTIELDGAVAGLIQYWEEREPKYRHAGIDLFVDPALHGWGVGSEAVRRVVRLLIDERGHHRITIDPASANVAAIRAYEKVGFKRVGVMRCAERDVEGEGWHDALLMELLAGEERM
jgi:GrpB-like predicted nucleotidyltransferase (UPF0157 family)/RimJ/RimL family protein N-acetyltransferase/predicted nucleotidyltransferase